MKLALAIILTATAGGATIVTHHTKRPMQVRPRPVSVQSLPLPLNVRASRAEHRLPLLLVTATPSTSPRRGVRRPVGSHPRPRRALPTSSSGTVLNWPALAQCESGGNPRTNTGNGFYGAYQFDLETWRSVGGHGLPSENSLAEQTYRARLLYDQRGRAPWPVCGSRL